jgi:hypothetical protein
MRLNERPTADLIVIALTGVVVFSVIASIIGLFLIEIYDPNRNVEDLSARVATIISSLVSGIIGYIAGKRSNGS